MCSCPSKKFLMLPVKTQLSLLDTLQKFKCNAHGVAMANKINKNDAN
jgi:hypothetical protein